MLRSICSSMYKSSSSLTLHNSQKLCFSISRTTYGHNEAIEENQQEDVKEKADTKKQKALANLKKEEDKVFQFFNSCDYVTLRKLKNSILKMTPFKQVENQDLIKPARVAGLRFENINDLLETAKIKPNQVPAVAKAITSLEKKEASMNMKHMYPPFPLKKIKDVKHIVSLDVFQNKISWSVQTLDRTITEVGHHTMFEKSDKNVLTFDHMAHTKEMKMVLDKIPQSNVYLMVSRRRNIKKMTGSNIKYAMYESLMEALVITMLNSRETLGYSQFTEKEHLGNCVYLVNIKAFQDFHNLVLGGELLSCKQVVQDYLQTGHGGLQGITFLNTDIVEALQKESEDFLSEDLSKCVVMSDVFCQNMTKSTGFPNAYSVNSAIPFPVAQSVQDGGYDIPLHVTAGSRRDPLKYFETDERTGILEDDIEMDMA